MPSGRSGMRNPTHQIFWEVVVTMVYYGGGGTNSDSPWRAFFYHLRSVYSKKNCLLFFFFFFQMLPFFPLDFYQLIALRRFFFFFFLIIVECLIVIQECDENPGMSFIIQNPKRWEDVDQQRSRRDRQYILGQKQQLGVNDVGIINAWLTQHRPL